jgi:DNA-binding XRE family transcriptional regulator
MKSPAQRLAETVRRERPARNKSPQRKAVWDCHIRDMRERLELTLDDVAEAVGITKAGLSVIERGSDPMLTTARKLAVFYGMPIDALWITKGTP